MRLALSVAAFVAIVGFGYAIGWSAPSSIVLALVAANLVVG